MELRAEPVVMVVVLTPPPVGKDHINTLDAFTYKYTVAPYALKRV